MAWRFGSVVMAAMAAAMLLGCSVHLPPTRQVTFDYSDYAYYDRGYAPSPSTTHMLAGDTPMGYTGGAEVRTAPSEVSTLESGEGSSSLNADTR